MSCRTIDLTPMTNRIVFLASSAFAATLIVLAARDAAAGGQAGALLAIVTKGNLFSSSLSGGALGYRFGEIKKDPSKSNNVTLNTGTKFGVRLTKDLRFDSNGVVITLR